MRLDTHQHFWALANPFTDWPPPELTAIHRDFGPDDLRGRLKRAEIAGTILVQAAPSLAESEYCLALAKACDFVKGVVGWIDVEADDALQQLARLAADPLLKGLRVMAQAVDRPGWLTQPQFAPVFSDMARRNLPLDGLVLAHQIGDLDALARCHPTLRIVLDHGGKPPIAGGDFAIWARDIARLAANRNVHCKLSGLWTEAGGDIALATIRPWAIHLLDSFGPARLMWGSDWPVIGLAGEYGDWLAQCEELLADLGEDDRAAIFGNNGVRFYGIA